MRDGSEAGLPQFIYLGDRWEQTTEDFGQYIWLPLFVNETTGVVRVQNESSWRYDLPREVGPSPTRTTQRPAAKLAEDPYARAERLVALMTLDEKLAFVQQNRTLAHGGYTGVLPGLPRLGIPELRMNDGPVSDLEALVVLFRLPHPVF